MSNKEDSIKKRYLYRLFTNVLVIPMGIITQTIIARSLGAASYGDFSFLTNFFARIISFLENGTSTFYYTKLSQRQEDKGLVKFYWMIFAGIAIISFLFVLCSGIFHYKDFFWPNQVSLFVIMALVYSLIIFIYNTSNIIVDAHGLTVKGEISRMIIKVFGLIVLVTIYYTISLDLTLFFIYNYLINALLILSFWFVLKKNHLSIFPSIKLSFNDIKRYGKEFFVYSHPLIVLSFMLLVSSILDIWLLQRFSGSVQQGYYGFGQKLAALCFIFASSLTSIIMREYSRSYANNDIDMMRTIFQTYIPPIYVLIAFISVFISVNAYSVLQILAGKEFLGGAMVLAIMILYPLHQTYGQLSGSIFFAMGRTREFRNISAVITPIGVIIALFMILPEKYGGLNAGALGLVIKIVVIQFVGVNIQLWYNAKQLKFSYSKLLFHQLYVILVFYLIGLLSSYVIGFFFSFSLLISLIINGVLYAAIFFTLFYYKSNIFLLYYKVDSKQIIEKLLIKAKFPLSINRNKE